MCGDQALRFSSEADTARCRGLWSRFTLQPDVRSTSLNTPSPGRGDPGCPIIHWDSPWPPLEQPLAPWGATPLGIPQGTPMDLAPLSN